MDLTYIERPWTHATDYGPRPIVGIVLHHSAGTTDVTTFQVTGGWHYLIGTSGTLYRDVPEPLAAWHCGASDRWRPAWLRRAPGQRTSDPNYCTVGIEVVYAPQYGAVANDAQYATLRALLADLCARYGSLPVVGHGELDTARWPTEPHGLEWPRAGLSERTTEGRWFLGLEDEMVHLTDEQREILRVMAALNANAGSIDQWINQLGAQQQRLDELAGERDQASGLYREVTTQLDGVRAQLAERDSALGALQTITVPALEGQVASLEGRVQELAEQVQHPPSRQISQVAVTFETDGMVQRFTPAPL